MPLSRTNLLGQVSPTPTGNFGTGNFTSTSFSPPSSSLLVVAACYCENNGTTTDPSSVLAVSGGGLTYTSRLAQAADPTAFPTAGKIWTAPVSTGSSMTIGLTTSGRTAGIYAISVVAYTGYDTGTPVGATGSNFGSPVITGGGAIAESLTLSGAPATTSEVFGFLACDRNTSGGATPGSTFTEIHDVTNTDWGGLESQVRTGSASTTVDWVDVRTGGTGTLFNFVILGMEVRAAPVSGYVPAPRPRPRQAVAQRFLGW